MASLGSFQAQTCNNCGRASHIEYYLQSRTVKFSYYQYFIMQYAFNVLLPSLFGNENIACTKKQVPEYASTQVPLTRTKCSKSRQT